MAFLDSDDVWPPDKLAWQVEALSQHPEVAVVYGRVACIDESGEPTNVRGEHGELLPWQMDGPSGNIFWELMDKNRIVSVGQTLIRRNALAALDEEPFDPAIWGCDDWDLWLRLARRNAFLFVPRLAFCYRWHATSMSKNAVRMSVNECKMLRKVYLRDKDSAVRKRLRKYLRSGRWRMRDGYAGASVQANTNRDFGRGFRQLLTAVLYDPRLLLRRWVVVSLLRSGWRGLFVPVRRDSR